MDTSTIPEAVAKTIDVLAAKLGATGAALWHQLCLYAQIRAACFLLAAALALAFCTYVERATRASRKTSDHEADYLFGIGALFFCAGAFVLIAVCSSLPVLLVPEGSVLVWLMGSVR